MVVRWLIVVLALVFVLLVGANIAWHTSLAAQIVPIKSGDDNSIVAYRLEVEQDYETKGIDFMEEMGDRLRQDESRVAGGNTRLFEFYNVLADINCQCRNGDRKTHAFEDRERRLQDWLNRYPRSTTATLAMATLWEYRAWQLVGGYAYHEPLSDAQKDAFDRAVDVSRAYLRQLRIKDDPYVAYLWMRMEYDEEPSREEIDDLYARSTKTWPRHYQIYYLYASMLTRLFKDDKARAALVKELAAAKDETDKQVGLSYIIGGSYGSWLPYDLPWEDVKHAYYVRYDKYGWRNRDWNAMCRMAVTARDWVGARYCFRQINGYWDDETWSSQNEFVWYELVASLH